MTEQILLYHLSTNRTNGGGVESIGMQTENVNPRHINLTM